MSDNKQHYHDKGEQDAAEDKGYNPPHGVTDSLISWGKEEQRHIDENKAYEKGWDNAKSQKKD